MLQCSQLTALRSTFPECVLLVYITHNAYERGERRSQSQETRDAETSSGVHDACKVSEGAGRFRVVQR